MNHSEEKRIQKKKRTGYNIYGIRDSLFYLLVALACAVILIALADLMVSGWPLMTRVVLYVAILAAAAAAAVAFGKSSQAQVEAYRRQEGFEFIGLYDLADAQLTDSSDILSREEEAHYLSAVLENLIFRQTGIKQALCLTGRSGCGKSTILSFFKKEYQDQYQIYDFTGYYYNFEAALAEMLGSDPEQRLQQECREKKVIFILDQFERFFFLPPEKRERMRELMIRVSRKNTAMILSMREEYLADFMKEFDVNNMKRDNRQGTAALPMGILNNLTSVIRDDVKNYHVIRRQQQNVFREWKGMSVKENFLTHLDTVGGYLETTTVDPVGNTIFYCENQNDAPGGKADKGIILENKCERLFGERGQEYFAKHREEPLIEQQIIFHMAEYEKKTKQRPEDEVRELLRLEEYELLEHYFDTQLAATGDYYDASRILYLLSQARINQMVLKREDLEYGLFENQFSRDGHRKVNDVIECLEDLQLIRKNIRRSDQEYEIAHDFIAQAFLSYSSSNLDRNVRSALDLFMAEMRDTNRQAYMEEKRRYNEKAQKSRYYAVVGIVAAVAAAAAQLILTAAANPWDSIWAAWNVYGDVTTVLPMLVMLTSMLYMYQVYQKVLQYCRGRRERQCRVIYLILMAGAVLGVVFYPYGMMFFGIFLAVMGLNCVFLLDGSYQKSSRKELQNYGWKCSLIGIAYAVLHVLFFLFNEVFPVYYVFIEMVMMFLLIGYSFIAHMTREYLYGRRMDAGSERVR